ncbi:S8 family peptidase [Mycolicibacterium sp. 050158]|uniref:S8 family peptidase n=1 Tax=Mycolicibacterium sp. 050158 TaxID=3090602 RepID=UPI00299EE121|nr:S8 family peptidase [Mycolicibacterium sp. 050158]MDX1888661.1 S8 family peptidase [Mycolicibacterium sp. 050158]
MAVVGAVDEDMRAALSQDPGPAVVGVLDSGINTAILEPWVMARESYDLGSEQNPEHGTFVGGLILGGGALNPGEACFEGDSARLIDGQVLPAGPSGIGELELLERITEVVRRHPEVKIWNCSFARRNELRPVEYSVFASEMDALSSELEILFVQAAGNFEDGGGRPWPPIDPLSDGIASPADSVNSLVVGSISHRGGRTPVGAPASYSRRGPSFGGQTKPDVSFWSGDVGPLGEVPYAGIRSLVPNDQIAEGVGTSFATPLISAIAANVWSEIDDVEGVDAAPALIKGLIVHGAATNSRELVANHRNYYGAGIPFSGTKTLFEDSNSFTTVHDVTLASKISWLRAPFPIPACLLTPDGKLRAEIFMTISYNPILDRACGQEAVRTCVDGSFGVVDRTGETIKITGKAPEEKTTGAHPWESDLVAAGKWSPVRTHHARFPRGCAGDEWGLKLSLTERHDYEDGIEQRAYAIVTLRGLDDGLPVHADGLQAIQQLALWNAPLSVRTSVTVEV